jgi:hypothetical protein
MSAAAKVEIRLKVGMMNCGKLEGRDVCKCCCAKGMLDGCDVELKASWDAFYTESTTALVALQQEHIEITEAWNGHVSSHPTTCSAPSSRGGSDSDHLYTCIAWWLMGLPRMCQDIITAVRSRFGELMLMLFSTSLSLAERAYICTPRLLRRTCRDGRT